MDNRDKELYVAPAVISLGTPAEITQAGNVPNADSPSGRDNTAYPPGVGS